MNFDLPIPMLSFGFSIFMALIMAIVSYFNAISNIKVQIESSYDKLRLEVKSTYATKEEFNFVKENVSVIRSEISDIRSFLIEGKKFTHKDIG